MQRFWNLSTIIRLNIPNMNNPQLYILNQSLEVVSGIAVPWFGQYGGGTQYLLPQTIKDLLALSILSKYP